MSGTVPIRCVAENDASIIYDFQSIMDGARWLEAQNVEGGSFPDGIRRAIRNRNAYRGYFWSRIQNANAEPNDTPADTGDAAMNFILDQTTGATVRVTMETPRRVSVFDLITGITGVQNPRMTLDSLCTTYPEIVNQLYNFTFGGQGQRATPVVDARGAVMIINLLPGPNAARFRIQSAHLIVRFLGGDETLIEEIQANRAMQQSINTNHPARIFGEAVEYERYQLASPNMQGKYLDSYIDKPVVYIIVFVIDGQIYIKFGRTEKATGRMDDHYKTYPNASIYCVYEAVNLKQIEDSFKSILRYRNKLTELVIRGRKYTEIAHNLEPSEAEEILLKAIEDSNHTGYLQVRLAEIRLREKELEAQQKIEMMKLIQSIVANNSITVAEFTELIVASNCKL